MTTEYARQRLVNNGGVSPVAMDVTRSMPQQQREKKSVKGTYVVPHDDDDPWTELQEPLRMAAREASDYKKTLASSRVARDKLMRVMEDLILKEAELASAYELFDYSRQRYARDHDEIVERLEHYEQLLRDAQAQEAALQADGVDVILTTEQERERWRHTKVMVHATLPQLLGQLEESIDFNNAKIRQIHDKMEEIRAQRLCVREEIAEKEEDIALALASATK
ncbi:hypothetical protein Poli38472_001185 [Pythium oligandrum]|uniref:Uncharacterized protein n=1 Tax=Pythium oligandrum TaxID=41045 RepID=A0A8K1FQ44_PYTOL|nr:hypothetical protein Poli38472_001185 [Pythium oligandrum]|eukprot:TMW69029.1 hypothetical protein Poli38472_001185 [Pythium oligandrum]